MDYKELLKKYIDHVGRVHGCNGIKHLRRKVEVFTQEEWAELLKVRDESFETYTKKQVRRS